MQALSAVHAEGATAAVAQRWSRDFFEASPLAPDGRRTSLVALAGDKALVRAALARPARLEAGEALGPAAWPRAGARSGAGRRVPPAVEARPRDDPALVRLTARMESGVEILAPPDPAAAGLTWRITAGKGGFVGQAALLDAARAVWQQQGRSVAVATPSDGAARRWRALAGLDRHAPGAPPPAVLIVDRADRRTSAELTALLDRSPSLVILVEGGTLPPRRAAVSQGLTWLAEQKGRILPVSSPDLPGRTDVTTAGRLAACSRGRQAIEEVVSIWSQGQRDGAPLRMVGLGPAECDELNRQARAILRRAGALTGREVDIAGRPFAVGDAVVATRRGVLPAGAAGRVRAIDGHGGMLVRWSGAPVTIAAFDGRHLRHAYATTPGMLRFDDRPLVALGDPSDLGRHRHRVVAAVLVAPTVARPIGAATIDETFHTRVDALARMAESDPASVGLGPVPGDGAGRAQWRVAARHHITAAAARPDLAGARPDLAVVARPDLGVVARPDILAAGREVQGDTPPLEGQRSRGRHRDEHGLGL